MSEWSKTDTQSQAEFHVWHIYLLYIGVVSGVNVGIYTIHSYISIHGVSGMWLAGDPSHSKWLTPAENSRTVSVGTGLSRARRSPTRIVGPQSDPVIGKALSSPAYHHWCQSRHWMRGAQDLAKHRAAAVARRERDR